MKLLALIPFALLLSGCHDAPSVTVCVYSADRCEFDCTGRDGKQFFKDCRDPLTDKFEAMPSQDFHELLLWIKNHD